MISQFCNFVVMFLVLFLASFLSIFGPQQTLVEPLSSPTISVYFFLLDDCKICRDYGHELNAIYDQYNSEEIEFIGVFPNFSSKKENIEKFKKEFDIGFELRTDYFKKLSKKFDAKILPEVFVYDNRSHKVIYSGRIDDRYVSIGQRKQIVRSQDLRLALDNIISKKEILITRTEPIGCFINYNDNL